MVAVVHLVAVVVHLVAAGQVEVQVPPVGTPKVAARVVAVVPAGEAEVTTAVVVITHGMVTLTLAAPLKCALMAVAVMECFVNTATRVAIALM